MNYKQHLGLGLITTIIFLGVLLLANTLYLLGLINWFLEHSWLILVLTLFSPLVMDLDHNNGKLRQILLGLGLVALITGVTVSYLTNYLLNEIILFSSLALVIVYSVALLFKHRGFTHSWSFIILLSVITGLMTKEWLIAVLNALLMWSHLIGDKIPFKIK